MKMMLMNFLNKSCSLLVKPLISESAMLHTFAETFWIIMHLQTPAMIVIKVNGMELYSE